MMRINIKFLIICLVSGLFAIFFGGELPYTIFYIFLIAFIVGLIYSLFAVKSLSARVVQKQEKYTVGDEEVISMMIENDRYSYLPYVHVINKEINEQINDYNGHLISLDMNGSSLVKQKVKFNKRGIYDFGIIEAIIQDFFLIFTVKKTFDNKFIVKIYPKIHNLEYLNIAGSDNYEKMIRSQKGIEDLTLIKDIRKYMIGDSLRKVHWKLSAKHNELYVKNFDNVSGKECNVFINMNKNNYNHVNSVDYEERLVDFCVSLVNILLKQEIRTKLLVNSYDFKTFNIEDKFDFDEIMEYFLVQKSDGETEFYDFINSNLKYISRRGWIIIITLNVDKHLRNSIIDLNESGYTVKVFYCAKETESHENINVLEKLGVDCVNFIKMLN